MERPNQNCRCCGQRLYWVMTAGEFDKRCNNPVCGMRGYAINNRGNVECYRMYGPDLPYGGMRMLAIWASEYPL